ncbi:uncharacterized protein LOC131248385 [Magnolia sinica]|uniref:uncharacterized protein LOC131248385 n=1 Tax=Magnolia sinica TaxID=86752 RepID=UPI0026592A55|nr:uncharacterized protein LOC131248385 [Magnolia sinica]XP_058104638.1 uncharacterized protein LOC131248385 [Magnolia sinica]
MARGRGSRDLFNLGDPFTGFGGFGDQRSLLSNFFEKDPFEDPFFTRPFGSMFGAGMLGRNMFGPDMLGPSMFGSGILGSGMLGPSTFGPGGSPFRDMRNVEIVEHQDPHLNKSKGVVIEELSSDSEEEEDKGTREKKDNPRKHSRLGKEPFVQDPDDETEDRKRKHAHYMSEYSRTDRMQPQTQTFSFQSSKVTYGGANGAYYTSSTTRRTGGDGLTVEESKEADTTTRKATHRISKGIHDKGHSVTRKLNSDGKVDTMQTLHNLNEDELPDFEETWKGNARKHLPGWNQGFDVIQSGHMGRESSHGGQNRQMSRGWALPSTESPQNPERTQSRGNARFNSSNGRA